MGVGAARAAIYAAFDGYILCCLDTEQVVDDDWVMEHIRIHQRHPEAEIVSKARGHRPGGPVTSPLGSDFFTQGNCSVKSGALDRVDGWYPWFHRGEDWDMCIRLWCAGVTAFATPAVQARGLSMTGTRFWFRRNMDAGTDQVSKAIREFRILRQPDNIKLYLNLRPRDYLTLVYNSACLVVKPSEGI